MRRLIVLIAVVFAFAALAGPTTAHAHRYVSTPIVVLNHVDALNQSIPVVVQIQRGEIDLGAGLLMPCGPHHGIAVSIPTLPMMPACARPDDGYLSTQASEPGIRLLRPPISA